METCIENIDWHGMPAFRLDNGELAVTVLPGRGGKVASIRRTGQSAGTFAGRDCLQQPAVRGPETPLAPPRYDGPFTADESWGFDDLWPGVDPGPFPAWPWKGIPIPDHGELWALPFGTEAGDRSFTLSTGGIRFPYRFVKRLTLDGRRLVVDYRVENLSPFPLGGSWTAHALFDAEPGARLELAPGTTKILNAVPGLAFPERGTVYPWPKSGDGTDRSVIPPRRAIERAWQKYYAAGRVNAGSCSLTYPDGRAVRMTWDAAEIPYLGIWVNEGGWNGQYTVGLEPSTGGMDSPTAAREYGQEAEPVPPHGSREWRLVIEAA